MNTMLKRLLPKANASQGFSLLEMAVVLVISGLLVGMANKTQSVTGEANGCYGETKKQLDTIKVAIDAFANKNQRFPIPAGRSLGVTDLKLGHETVLPADIANIDRLTNGNNLLFGALPFQALGLSQYYATDCWGNKLSYVVTEKMTTSATSGGFPDSAVVGGISLKTSASVTIADTAGTPPKGLAYAVISHGETAVGGVRKNYTGVSHGWCGASAVLDNENCDIANNVLMTANFNNGTSAGNAFFDDLIVFGGKDAVGQSSVCTYNACGYTDGKHVGVWTDSYANKTNVQVKQFVRNGAKVWMLVTTNDSDRRNYFPRGDNFATDITGLVWIDGALDTSCLGGGVTTFWGLTKPAGIVTPVGYTAVTESDGAQGYEADCPTCPTNVCNFYDRKIVGTWSGSSVQVRSYIKDGSAKWIMTNLGVSAANTKDEHFPRGDNFTGQAIDWTNGPIDSSCLGGGATTFWGLTKPSGMTPPTHYLAKTKPDASQYFEQDCP